MLPLYTPTINGVYNNNNNNIYAFVTAARKRTKVTDRTPRKNDRTRPI